MTSSLQQNMVGIKQGCTSQKGCPAGLAFEDLSIVVEALAICKAGKQVKALKLGPPVDGMPSGMESLCLGVRFLQAPKKACPKLQVLTVWGMDTPAADPEETWTWTNIEGNGLQGTCLDE